MGGNEGTTLAPGWPSVVTALALVALMTLLSCSDSGTGPAPAEDGVTLELVSGDEQYGMAGSTLTDSLVVRARKRDGSPAPGVRVRFAAQHGGAVQPELVTSSADGLARAAWSLGSGEGAQNAEARVEGSSAGTLNFRATARASFDLPLEGLALAIDLANRLTSAGSNQERARAMLFVMRALNIGVYTPEGVPIVVGAERSSTDFFLYDFELDIMARALGRNQTWSIADAAGMLSEMGLEPWGQPLEPNVLRIALEDGTEDALSSPADAASRLPLLVHQLGLRRGYDLTTTDLDAVELDALQAWLIVADFALAALRNVTAPTGQSRLPEQSGGLVARATPPPLTLAGSSACDNIGRAASGYWAAGKYSAALHKLASAALDLAEHALDVVHAAMLANSIQIRAIPLDVQTHYGHGSDGASMDFAISVMMLDDLSKSNIACGWLSFLEWPKPGPVPDVLVNWAPLTHIGADRLQFLRFHGELDCGPWYNAPCFTMTDANGLARLTFKPRREAIPGVGTVREARGTVEGRVHLNAAFGNALGTISQLLIPKLVPIRWTVGYHVPQRLQIEYVWALARSNLSCPGDSYSASAHAVFPLSYDDDGDLFASGKGALNYSVSYTPGAGCTCPPRLVSHAGRSAPRGELWYTEDPAADWRIELAPTTWDETWEWYYLRAGVCTLSHRSTLPALAFGFSDYFPGATPLSSVISNFNGVWQYAPGQHDGPGRAESLNFVLRASDR